MRELAKAGVLVGFCGGGGTPLFSANEVDFEVAWFSPQSEYRPTEYLQSWVRFWFDDALRLSAAKTIQQARLMRIAAHWTNNRRLAEADFVVPRERLEAALEASRHAIAAAPDNTALLTEEARLTKTLFKLACDATDYGEFTRAKGGSGGDPANRFLDHGNYLAYGLAPLRPGCSACRTAWRCCTARPRARTPPWPATGSAARTTANCCGSSAMHGSSTSGGRRRRT
jgi:CRISPR-associated protein Cas1